MAKSYWAKLWYEVLDDRKMGRLPDHLWRRFFEFIMIAGESNNGGYLPSPEDISWRMRTSEDDILSSLQALAADPFKLVSQTPDGDWIITNYAKRQDADTNAERQRRYRERKHRSLYYGDEQSNGNVTKRNTDKEEDKDKEGTPTSSNSLDSADRIWRKIKPSSLGIPPSLRETVIPVVDAALSRNRRDEDATAIEGKKYFDAWCKTRNKRGGFYSANGTGWIDWWASGSIPTNNGNEPHYSEVHQ